MAQFILAPGPTQCNNDLLKKLSEPVAYHRANTFHNVYEKTRNYIKKIIGLDNGEVTILTTSGTGAMEASIANFFGAGDKVLVVSIGHFGHRFNDICTAYNLDVCMLDYPIGQTYNYDEVKKNIEENPDLKGVFITHHETSSGVVNDLEKVGALVKNMDECLFVVDSISGLMMHPMEMSKWGIDCLLAGSQKGFLIPPGVSFIACSDNAMSCLNRGNLPRYYWDLRKYQDMVKINETPFTPNISLIMALYDACKYIYEEIGLENNYNYYKNLRIYLSEKLKERGLDVDIVDEENKGNVLVMFRVKDDWNAKIIHDVLDERGYIIATGFGENKTKMLRVGVIGQVTKEDIDKFLVEFDKTIDELYK